MKKTLIVIVILIALVVGVLAYHDVFSKIEVRQFKTGPYVIVYERFTGPYQKVGPIMDNVYNNLKADGIETTRGIGIYYDNPQKVESAKCRSIVGCLVEGEVMQKKLKKLKDKYKIIKLPEEMCQGAVFPYKSKISLMIGPLVVYKAIMDFRKENKQPEIAAPGVEVYDQQNNIIQYFIYDNDSTRDLMEIIE